MNRIEAKRFPQTKFTNRLAWDVMPDNSWHNQPCFIIGGGPSLTHFKWSQLEGKLTIGINRVYEKFDPTIIFGMDPHFVRWILMGKYGEPAKKKFMESRAFKVWLLTSPISLPSYIHILKIWNNYASARRSFPFSMKQGIGHGNNSGYAALNFAACLGANPIYLLGFDMKQEATRTHWHDGHPENHGMQDEKEKLKMFTENFRFAAIALKKKRVEVINLNPDSDLPWFPKIAPAFIFNKEFSINTKNVLKTIPRPLPPPESKLPPIYIQGPYGFGDTLYLRPIIRHLAEKHETVYVRTTLPEAFWDLINVRFVRPTINRLWTQGKHIEYLDKCPAHKWDNLPRGIEQKSWGSFLATWSHDENERLVTTNPRGEESTTKYFENEFCINEFDFIFPLKREWMAEARKALDSLDTKGKKICIVRQPTMRPEWNNTARDPDMNYLQLLIDEHKDEYYFISIAYIKKGVEWFERELKGVDKKFHSGEFPLTTIFALLKLADMVITYPDLFLIASIAVRAKCFCIFGGCAKPEIILDDNMGLENVAWVAPAPFCNCMKMEHSCHKKIPPKRILRVFKELKDSERYIKKATVGMPPGVGDMHWVLEIMESFKEKHGIDELTIKLTESEDHGYSTEFLKLLPFVDRVDASLQPLPFRFSIIGGDGVPLQKNVGGADYIMEFNSRLENGIKLKDILPEYEVNHAYPIDYPEQAKKFAKFVKRGVGGKLYLLYASSVGGNKNWCQGTWDREYWIELANKIYGATKCTPVLIGAKWDGGYAEDLVNHDKDNMILNLVGKTTMPEALALLREARAFVSFLSGLAILATRFKLPTVSFWPTKKLAPNWPAPELFQRSWIPPDAEKEGYYMPFNYGENGTDPAGVFKALEKHL